MCRIATKKVLTKGLARTEYKMAYISQVLKDHEYGNIKIQN